MRPRLAECRWREIEVGPEVIERARCDAEEIGSLTAGEPERVRTTVTPRVRRQVLARDHHRCTVPGWRSARNLDLHHIEFREHGGSHEMGNLTVVCSAHHQHLHEDRLTIRGRAPAECQVSIEERQRMLLPSRFVIYSYDCREHQPVEAECRADGGVWASTEIRPI